MMHTLFLLHYNNYYNRIMKREATLSDYQGYQVKYNGQDTDPNGNTAVIQGVNFVEGNFIDTTQVVNWGGDLPDYILVTEDNDITSRWFVVSTEKTRGGQLLLTLHRDVIVDFYDDIVDATMFVEKATLPPESPLVYNSEDMTFNQIKTTETLLKDDSQCPWICIYAASKDAEGSETSFQVDTVPNTVTISRVFDTIEDYTNSDIYKQSGKIIYGGPVTLESLRVRADDTIYSASGTFVSNIYYSYYMTKAGQSSRTEVSYSTDGSLSIVNTAPPFLNLSSQAWTELEEAIPNFIDTDNELFNDARQLNNQIIQVGTSGNIRYYRLRLTVLQQQKYDYKPQYNQMGSLLSIIQPELEQYLYFGNTGSQRKYFTFTVNFRYLSYTLEEITDSIETLSLSVELGRPHLTDAPYDLFCLPFSDELNIQVGGNTIISNKALNMTITRAFIEKYSGSSRVYDAQILPYCPLVEYDILDDGTNKTLNIPNAHGTSPIKLGTETVGYLIHATVSSFSRDIYLPAPVNINNYKIENQTDLYRLCSPNYNGVFELSAAKNRGLSLFHIQCTYKPYTPYIKVFPDWQGLYGSNFGENNFDARGLLCGGDFSLPMTSSAWATYEQQNKNYQLSFDRQITSMEVRNDVARQQEKWQVAAGTVGAITQGAVGGASVGSLAGGVGGLIGAGIGAVSAGAASLAGGLADIKYNERLRQEALSLTKDQFGYSLGNIKALPVSLSKTAAYNIDNKYFPFLEYYTCTDVEKLAFAEKIRNNGMTVGVISKWSDYINNTWTYTLIGHEAISDRGYFKARLISITGSKIDTHITAAIANELFQGVYLR